MKFHIKFKGGPGSGHHGHAGIPGKQGGSLPGSGSARNDLESWRKGPAEFVDDGAEVLERNEYQTSKSTQLARMDDGTLVVYKKQGNRARQTGAAGAMGEEVTYVIAKDYLGYDDLVPKSVAMNKSTSAQEYIKGGIDTKDGLFDHVDVDSYKKMVILDMVTGNLDRTRANFIVTKDGKVFAIDNDMTFTKKPRPYASVSSADAGYFYTGSMAHLNDGYTYYKMNPIEYQSVAKDLLGNSDFRNYITSSLGDAVWDTTEARLIDMTTYVPPEAYWEYITSTKVI